MKRRDLEQHLRDHGCQFDRHGGNHDIWVNPATNSDTSVPRHREIKKIKTIRSICKALQIPFPSKK